MRIVAGLLALLAIAAGGVALEFYVLSPRVRPAPQVHAPATPAAIARGRYLAEAVALCTSCHSPSDPSRPGAPVIAGQEYVGRDFSAEMEGFPGRVRAPNLTSDVETGIGAMTDGELLRALREGIGRDGRALIMMPFQDFAAALSDDDALAIVAYLRTLPPVRHAVPRTELEFPISMLVRAEPRPLDRPAPAMPGDRLARGKRLMKLAHCEGCHTTHDDHHQEVPGRRLAGGDRFPLPGGGAVHAANITEDRATGVGAWSDEELTRAIFEGRGRDGRPLFMMPWTSLRGMDEEDRRAVLAALRTVPAVRNAVAPYEATNATTAAR